MHCGCQRFRCIQNPFAPVLLNFMENVSLVGCTFIQELQVPVVTYQNFDGQMELDTKLQSEAEAEAAFDALETFSPFNKFRIGSEFDKIGNGKTGTRIFVYNLKTWGGSKCLFEWHSGGEQGEDGDQMGDIMIQGKRIRSRNGQTSQMVTFITKFKG